MDAEGKLLANKCPACEQIYFPKGADFCLNCLHDQLDEVQLGGKGILHTYARSELPSEFLKPPYVAGYVDLDENVRVFAPMHPDYINADIYINMPVEIVVGEVWRTEDESIVAYHFKPV